MTMAVWENNVVYEMCVCFELSNEIPQEPSGLYLQRYRISRVMFSILFLGSFQFILDIQRGVNLF